MTREYALATLYWLCTERVRPTCANRYLTCADRAIKLRSRHDWTRTDSQLRDVVGSDGGIVSGGKFERSCSISARSDDVLDLSRFTQAWRSLQPTAWSAARAARFR
jgi:hypothetical protein